MTKAKYETPEERRAAMSESARAQMLDAWEREREKTGKPLGYFGAHRRVRNVRGPAKTQTCACGRPALHWAHRHDTDPGDPANYEAMCERCHWRYDGVGERLSQRMLGAEGTRRAQLAWSRRTPEERRAIALRAWETRRRNVALASSPSGSGTGNLECQ